MLNWLMVLPCAIICMIDLCAGIMQFLKGDQCDSPKKMNIMQLSLSLFLVKYSVLNLFLVLLICSFPFWIITFIQADSEKGPFSSDCSFSMSANMYVMILNGKLHTSKLQKEVSNRIFHKKEKERERS